MSNAIEQQHLVNVSWAGIVRVKFEQGGNVAWMRLCDLESVA